MKKLCFAVMAMCMLLSCGGNNEKGAATEEATSLRFDEVGFCIRGRLVSRLLYMC